MRDIVEVFESRGDTLLVCNIGPGGEPVRLVSEFRSGAAPAKFVPTMGPGVLGVHVLDGAPAAEVQAAVRRETSTADYDSLSAGQHEVMQAASEAWDGVQQTGGEDPRPLVACAEAAVRGLNAGISHELWVENLMMMGGNSAVMLWLKHRNAAEAGRFLPTFSDNILKRRWLQGGPNGTFEAHEARNIMLALNEVQEATRPRPSAPPPYEPPPTKRWFGR